MEHPAEMDEQEQNIGELIGGLLRALSRRRWWVGLSALIVTLLAITVVMMLPDKYQSEATLVVVQQRIAQRFVEPTMNTGGSEAFYSMSREVLSRSQLMKIITDFGLYQEARARGVLLERLADRLLKDIKAEPQDVTRFGDIISFKISFSASNPVLAQNVTNRVASLFIEENLRKRSGQAATTTRFLADQIEAAKKRMSEQEQKVRDYKMRNLEELPQQQQALLAAVTDLRMQLQTTTGNLERIQQQRSSIQSQLGTYLARQQAEKESLLSRFTAKHPEVVKAEAKVKQAEELFVMLQLGTESAPASARVTDDTQLIQLRAQVESNLAEYSFQMKEQERLRREIAKSQGMLRLTPMREQELTEILRDYDIYRKDYADLLSKQMNAQLSATLEERNEGQQFRLVDPPTLPAAPTSPKRLMISLGALAGGIALGVGLALFIEMRNRVFYSEKDLRTKYALPIITMIPAIPTPEETARGRWRRSLEWVAASVLLVVLAAAELYVFKHG